MPHGWKNESTLARASHFPDYAGTRACCSSAPGGSGAPTDPVKYSRIPADSRSASGRGHATRFGGRWNPAEAGWKKVRAAGRATVRRKMAGLTPSGNATEGASGGDDEEFVLAFKFLPDVENYLGVITYVKVRRTACVAKSAEYA